MARCRSGTITRAKIARQIEKLARGIGMQKNLKEVSELKIDLGPGYRAYYALLDQKTLVVLICGGDKSTQSKDIEDAKRLWKSFVSAGAPKTALRLWREPEHETMDTQEPSTSMDEESEEKDDDTQVLAPEL